MTQARSTKHTASLSDFPPISEIRTDLVAIKDKILDASNLYGLEPSEIKDVRIVINTLIYILDNYQRDYFKHVLDVVLYEGERDKAGIKAYPNESYAPIHLEYHPTGDARIASLLRSLVVQFTNGFHKLDDLDPTRTKQYVKVFCGKLSGVCIDIRVGPAIQFVVMPYREEFTSLMEDVGKQYPSYFQAISALLKSSPFWRIKRFIADSGKNAFYKKSGVVDETSFPFMAQFLAEKSNLPVKKDFYQHYKITTDARVHLLFYGFLLQHDFIDELASGILVLNEQIEFDSLVCPIHPHKDLLVVAIEQFEQLIQNTDPNITNPLDFDPEEKEYKEEKAKVDPKRVEQRVKEAKQKLEAHRQTFVNLIKLTSTQVLFKWFSKFLASDPILSKVFSTYLSVQNILDILPFFLKACNAPVILNYDLQSSQKHCQILISILVEANFFEALYARSSFQKDFKSAQDIFYNAFQINDKEIERRGMIFLATWISDSLKKRFSTTTPAHVTCLYIQEIFTHIPSEVLKLILSTDREYYTRLFVLVSEPCVGTKGEKPDAIVALMIDLLLEHQASVNRAIPVTYQLLKPSFGSLNELTPTLIAKTIEDKFESSNPVASTNYTPTVMLTNNIFSLVLLLQTYIIEDKLHYLYHHLPRDKTYITSTLISHALRFLKHNDFTALLNLISLQSKDAIREAFQQIELADDIPKIHIKTLISRFYLTIPPDIMATVCMTAPNKLAALMQFLAELADQTSQFSSSIEEKSSHDAKSYLESFLSVATPQIISTLPKGQTEFVAHVANALLPLNKDNLKILASFPVDIFMAIIGARSTATKQFIYKQAIIDACQNSDRLFFNMIHKILNQLAREQKGALLQTSPLLRLIAEHAAEDKILPILGIVMDWSKSNIDLVRTIFSTTGVLLHFVEKRKIQCLYFVVEALDSDSLLDLLEKDDLLGNIAYHFDTVELSSFLAKIKFKLSDVQYKNALLKIVLHPETAETTIKFLLKHFQGVLTSAEITTVFQTGANQSSILKVLIEATKEEKDSLSRQDHLNSYIRLTVPKMIAKLLPLAERKDLNPEHNPQELASLLSTISPYTLPEIMAEFCLAVEDKFTSFVNFLAILEAQPASTANEKEAKDNYIKKFIEAALPVVTQNSLVLGFVMMMMPLLTPLTNSNVTIVSYFDARILLALLDHGLLHTNTLLSNAVHDLDPDQLYEFLMQIKAKLPQHEYESILKNLRLRADTPIDNVICLLHCTHRILSAEEMATVFLTSSNKFSLFKPFIEAIDNLPSESSIAMRRDEQKQEFFRSQDYSSRFIRACAPHIITSLTEQDVMNESDTRFCITMACGQLHAEEKETYTYAKQLLQSIRTCRLSPAQRFEIIVMFPQDLIIDALKNQQHDSERFFYSMVLYTFNFDSAKGKKLFQAVVNEPSLNSVVTQLRVPILQKLYEAAEIKDEPAKVCISKLIGYLKNEKIPVKRVGFAVQTIMCLIEAPVDQTELTAIQQSVLTEHGKSLFKSEIATFIGTYLAEPKKKIEPAVKQKVVVPH